MEIEYEYIFAAFSKVSWQHSIDSAYGIVSCHHCIDLFPYSNVYETDMQGLFHYETLFQIRSIFFKWNEGFR